MKGRGPAAAERSPPLDRAALPDGGARALYPVAPRGPIVRAALRRATRLPGAATPPRARGWSRGREQLGAQPPAALLGTSPAGALGSVVVGDPIERDREQREDRDVRAIRGGGAGSAPGKEERQERPTLPDRVLGPSRTGGPINRRRFVEVLREKRGRDRGQDRERRDEHGRPPSNRRATRAARRSTSSMPRARPKFEPRPKFGRTPDANAAARARSRASGEWPEAC